MRPPYWIQRLFSIGLFIGRITVKSLNCIFFFFPRLFSPQNYNSKVKGFPTKYDSILWSSSQAFWQDNILIQLHTKNSYLRIYSREKSEYTTVDYMKN